MTREYIRVTPSRSELAPRTVTQQLRGLHGIGSASQGLLGTLNPLNREPAPAFEFLAISAGEDEPVEFYYGAADRIDALEERLRTLYPPTFTIDRVEIDVRTKLIPPGGDEHAADEDRRGEDRELESAPGRPQAPASGAPVESARDESGAAEREPPVGDGGTVRDGESDGLDPVYDTADGSETDAGPNAAPGAEQPAGEAPGLATGSGRPAPDDVDPMGVRWYASPARRGDWMTTIPKFTETDPPGTDHSRAPLAQLIDQLTRAAHPIAFQAVFRRKPDWSPEAMERKRKLREGEDRLVDWFFSEVLGDPEHDEYSPSNTGRQRQYLDIGGRERVESIDEKEPQHTFTVNLRAIAFATEETDTARLNRRLDDLSTVFDHLNGAHYRIVPRRLRRGLRTRSRAENAVTRVLDREIVTGRWRTTRPDLVLGPAELANFVVVPPATELTTEGGRGSGAEPASRTPLPLPSKEHMRAFTGAGMTIGYGLGEDGDPTPEPIRIPPSLLPFHVGRFAKTGAGKSVALINDMLSLYDQTDGPVFLIDSKGGNLPDHYMRAHAKRFGVEDLEENVVHFPIPEILPGFAFFDIRPALESGVRRVDAVQDTADHYEEIIKLVMGPERYEEAVASPNLIKYLIKAMYDEEHGLENGHFREDVDYFTHDQLENAVTQFRAAGPPGYAPEEAPQSSDPRVTEKLDRYLRSTPTTFANVISGVSNRMDYITQDAHLRRLFNNTESPFDFRDLLDDDRVVMFDLGGLRDEAAKVMTGVILTALYDAVKSRDPDTLARKPDGYVANLLIDEAASVVVSDTLTTLLEKGREFRVSVELVTQFPEQMKEAGGREVYLNALNNIGSPLVGKIAVDRDLAEALAHEELDPVAFKNRIGSLPRGEWIAQLPSPEFGETGPDPFSLRPLPIPAGHPDGDRPLTRREEDRFHDALESVHERTQDEFGVPDRDAPSNRATRGDVAVEDDDRPFEVLMAEAIRTVQMRKGTREENGWVPVEPVDEEVINRIDENDLEARGYGALPAVREASPLIAVELHPDEPTVMTRLTEEGEHAAEPNTGTARAAGGDAHDDTLLAIEDALTACGFSVRILTQNGEEKPDAIATHPEIDATLSIEAETTTHNRPAKVLMNLRKAQDAGNIPVFVVPSTAGDQSGTDLASRIANILTDPVRRLSSGQTRLYTRDAPLTVGNDTEDGNRLVAARPATGDSRRTRWIRRDGGVALECEAGIEHARVTDFSDLSKEQFPAVYRYDAATGTYTVLQPGALPQTYESKAAFEAEWVPIKQPFLPEADLPTPEYTSDSYAIVVVGHGEEDDAVVFDPDEQTTRPLETLVEDAKAGVLAPAGTAKAPSARDGDPARAAESDHDPGAEPVPGDSPGEPIEDADEPPAGEATIRDASAGLAAFAVECLVVDEGNVIPVADVYEAYEDYAAEYGFAVRPKNRFTRELKQHIAFERDKRWLDGKSRRCYIGLALETPDWGTGSGQERGSER